VTVIRPRMEDFGAEYALSFDDWKAEHFGFPRPLTPRRALRYQAEPQRLRGLSIGHEVFVLPRASWWHRAGVLVLQTVAWATLVLTGVLCLAATLLFLWGVTQAFALLIHALLRMAR
jgi:hypothetical protein